MITNEKHGFVGILLKNSILTETWCYGTKNKIKNERNLFYPLIHLKNAKRRIDLKKKNQKTSYIRSITSLQHCVPQKTQHEE